VVPLVVHTKFSRGDFCLAFSFLAHKYSLVNSTVSASSLGGLESHVSSLVFFLLFFLPLVLKAVGSSLEFVVNFLLSSHASLHPRVAYDISHGEALARDELEHACH
jgi:hypothetical protein